MPESEAPHCKSPLSAPCLFCVTSLFSSCSHDVRDVLEWEASSKYLLAEENESTTELQAYSFLFSKASRVNQCITFTGSDFVCAKR